MRLTALILSLLLACQAAHAGPWPREKGTYFISAGGNFLLSDGAQLPVYYDPTLYLEYGVQQRLKIGLDMHTADAARIGTVFVFATVPLGDLDARHKFAASFALGMRVNTLGETENLIRGGLSWGIGLDHGWVSVDASATKGSKDPLFRPKADITYGRHWGDDWTTTLQLQTGQGFTSDYYAKIVPSVTYNLRDNLKLTLGSVHALTGDRGTGMKFETWLTF